jgi:hypothetical protein
MNIRRGGDNKILVIMLHKTGRKAVEKTYEYDTSDKVTRIKSKRYSKGKPVFFTILDYKYDKNGYPQEEELKEFNNEKKLILHYKTTHKYSDSGQKLGSIRKEFNIRLPFIKIYEDFWENEDKQVNFFSWKKYLDLIQPPQ